MIQSTQAATPQVSPRAALCSAIDDNAQLLASYLPPNVTAARFIALATRAVLDNRDLWDCDSNSVLRALSAAAASGLAIDGKMSSLIVRQSKHGKPVAVWDPSYRGMVYLALESGQVTSVEAHAVFARDEFAVALGTDAAITHRPCLTGERGQVVAAYAVGTLRSGAQVREVLGIADLEKIRAMSPAGERGPWQSWPERMAMKSAMRRLLKRLPAADIGSRVEHVQRHLFEASDPDAGESYAARLAPPARRSADPQHTVDLEARALTALNEAGSAADLRQAWSGIRAEYQQLEADVPLPIEARYHEHLEKFEQA